MIESMDVIFWGDFDAFGGSAVSSVANADSVNLRLSSSGGSVPPLLFIRDSVLTNCQAQLTALEQQHKNLRTVLVYSETDLTKVWDWLGACPSIAHIMPLRSANSYDRIQDLLAKRECRFLPQDLRDSNQFEMQNSVERYDAFKTLSDYIATLNCFSDFANITATAASELLTNAFFNAKRDKKTGQPVMWNRKDEVRLESSELIKFMYGRDASFLWLMVRDPFGTIDRATLIKAIGRAARDRTPLTHTGGAGLGLHMLFSWATELNVLVHPGQSTAMACKFLLTPRNRLFEAEPSALHFLSPDSSW